MSNTSANYTPPSNGSIRDKTQIRTIGDLLTKNIVDGYLETTIDGVTGTRTVKIYNASGVDVTATHEVAPKVYEHAWVKSLAQSTTYENSDFATDKPNSEVASLAVGVTSGSGMTATVNSGTATEVLGEGKSWGGLSGDTTFSFATVANNTADITITYRTYSVAG